VSVSVLNIFKMPACSFCETCCLLTFCEPHKSSADQRTCVYTYEGTVGRTPYSCVRFEEVPSRSYIFIYARSCEKRKVDTRTFEIMPEQSIAL
jgi:hypothetical protein